MTAKRTRKRRPLRPSDIAWYRGASARDFRDIGRISGRNAYLRNFPGVAIGRVKKAHQGREFPVLVSELPKASRKKVKRGK